MEYSPIMVLELLKYFEEERRQHSLKLLWTNDFLSVPRRWHHSIATTTQEYSRLYVLCYRVRVSNNYFGGGNIFRAFFREQAIKNAT